MRYRVFILTVALSLSTLLALAQSLPGKDGERARYNVQIDIRNAYISGICGMLFEDGKLKASIVNEFGFSAMDFEYCPQKDKVRIVSVMNNLDHWYIKRVLKRDIRELLHRLDRGEGRYEDVKYKITYTFTPMEMQKDDVTE